MNKLLAALPTDEYARLASHLTLIPLRSRQLLHKRDEPLKQILFPSRALCSLVVTMEDGATAEAALVGAEGLIGVEAILGQRIAACDAMVQAPGDGAALVMSADDFHAQLTRSRAFEAVMTRYSLAFVGFVTQSVACSGLHHVEARCCRWLLHAQDRLETSELPLTHDLLSTMLGVRRPTVTIVINELVHAGILSATRGVIRIVDREMLAARACECYKAISGIYTRSVPSPRPRESADVHEARRPERDRFVGGPSIV